MIEQICKTCRHWKRLDERYAGRVPDDAIRHCTARPPVTDFRWPRTNAEHTCGRWEQEPEAKETEPLKLESAIATSVTRSRKTKA